MPRPVSIKAQQAGGGVYLLCFSSSIGSSKHRARHYVGFAKSSIYNRVTQHRAASGRSASITRAAVKAGVKLTVARIWPGADRNFERSLKKRHNHAALCPFCAAGFAERTRTRRRVYAALVADAMSAIAQIAPCETCDGSGTVFYRDGLDTDRPDVCPSCYGTGDDAVRLEDAAYVASCDNERVDHD